MSIHDRTHAHGRPPPRALPALACETTAPCLPSSGRLSALHRAPRGFHSISNMRRTLPLPRRALTTPSTRTTAHAPRATHPRYPSAPAVLITGTASCFSRPDARPELLAPSCSQQRSEASATFRRTAREAHGATAIRWLRGSLRGATRCSCAAATAPSACRGIAGSRGSVVARVLLSHV